MKVMHTARATQASIVVLVCAGGLAWSGCNRPMEMAGTTDPPDATNDLTVYVNPADPLLLSAATADGAALQVFGERDAEGLPTKATSLCYQTAEQVGTDSATWVFLDDDSRVSRFVDADGTTIAFDWVSSTRLAVRVVSSDGTFQGCAAVDLEETEATPGLSVPQSYELRSRTRTSPRLAVPVEPAGKQAVVAAAHAQQVAGKNLGRSKRSATAQSSQQGQVLVRVWACEAPVANADVYVVAGNPFNSMLPTYPARPTITPGVYVATVPTVRVVNINAVAAAVCEAAVSVLGWGCTAAQAFQGRETLVCATVAVLIDTLTIPSGEAVPIMALCETGFAALNAYCSTLGYGAAPGAPSAADVFCAAVREYADRGPEDPRFQVTMYAVARAPGLGKAVSPEMTVSVRGPFPDQTVTFDIDGPIVRPLLINPRYPTVGQGYTVTTTVGCVSSDDSVRLTMWGSDEHSDSVWGVIQNGEASLIMHVPGAANEGIVDEIKLEINGSVMAREIVWW